MIPIGAMDDDQLTEAEKAIRSEIERLTADTAAEYLDKRYQEWDLNAPVISYEAMIKTSFRNCNVPLYGDIRTEEGGVYGYNEIADNIKHHEQRAVMLYHRLKELGLLLPGGEVYGKMLGVMKMVVYAKQIVLSTFQGLVEKHDQRDDARRVLDADINEQLGAFMLRFGWYDYEKLNKMQRLIIYLLDVAFRLKVRKADGLVYEPITYNGHYTHAWRVQGDITQFVFEHCRKELNMDQWLYLTSSGGMHQKVVDYLENARDVQFPTLKKNRSVFSFRNGVYDAAGDTFHPYETITLSQDVVAAKFFDLDFVDHQCHWTEIQTPHLQGIMDNQGWNEEGGVCDWMYIFIGRSIYDVGELDGWQIIPYLKGHAGVGKSTILDKVVGRLYDPVDVGRVGNSIERNFGLSAFCDKFVFLAPEIRADFHMDQADWQSIVSGEGMSVKIKHKTAMSIERWKPTGWFAGNELFSFMDSQGSVARRVALFTLQRPVRSGDMKLGDKLLAELPAIIQKANKAYHEKALTHGDKNIWTILPKYFQDTKKEITAETNHVESFLQSDHVCYGETLFVPFQDFKDRLAKYLQENNLPKMKLKSMDLYRAPFDDRKLSIGKATEKYNQRKRTCEYVFGIDLQRIEDDQVIM